MQYRLMYVETGTGAGHNGQAWIGKVFFSRSGKTVYFNGMSLRRGRGWATELITGDPYWISGLKKNGQDRHWAATARTKIIVDKEVLQEYLQFRGLKELPKSMYEIGSLNNTPPIEEATKVENAVYGERKEWLFQNGSYAGRDKGE